MSMCLVFIGPPPFGSSWVKRYSTFVKEQKILHMVTFDHRSGGKIVSSHKTQSSGLLIPHNFYDISTTFTMQSFTFQNVMLFMSFL